LLFDLKYHSSIITRRIRETGIKVFQNYLMCVKNFSARKQNSFILDIAYEF